MRQRFFDEKDRDTIGWIKRFMEYQTMIPGFSEEVAKAPAETMQKYGFPLNPEDAAFKPMDPKNPKKHMEAIYPDSKAPLYAEFMNRKFRHLEELTQDCRPDHEKFATWREIQMSRCVLDLGPQYTSVIHTPLIFEMAVGCSVGCEFCGLNAGPLKELFRYTDENAALWKDILTRAKGLIGYAAGEGTLYFASEPLDNPDYEKFQKDYTEIFGTLPQITTATASRHIERLRPLINELNEDGRFIYRFSVLSQEIYHELCKAFTPGELALVELLPQYDEAPGHHFANTGRHVATHETIEELWDLQDRILKAQESGDEIPDVIVSGSISCISGFLVNMCTKTITLTTPTWSDDAHPNGQIILAKEHFTDAADFQAKLEMMIERDMKTYLSPKDVIGVYPYLRVKEQEDGIEVVSCHGTKLVMKTKDQNGLLQEVFALAAEGCHTRREIVQKIIASGKFSALQSEFLYYLINRYWKSGIFAAQGTPH